MAYDRSKDPAPHDAKPWMMRVRSSAAVTPDDNTDLSGTYPIQLRVISAGTLSYIPAMNEDGVYHTTQSLPAGYVLDVVVRRVRSTGTTATVIAEYL